MRPLVTFGDISIMSRREQRHRRVHGDAVRPPTDRAQHRAWRTLIRPAQSRKPLRRLRHTKLPISNRRSSSRSRNRYLANRVMFSVPLIRRADMSMLAVALRAAKPKTHTRTRSSSFRNQENKKRILFFGVQFSCSTSERACWKSGRERYREILQKMFERRICVRFLLL